MKYLIDEPTIFDPVGVWVEFLAGLERLDQSATEVRRLVRVSKDIIKDKDTGDQ